MSETFENTEDLLNDDQPGDEQLNDSQSSGDNQIGETSADSDGEADVDTKKSRFVFNVYDAMMLIALVCVTVATIELFRELTTFGALSEGFPWKTAEVRVK